MGPKTRSGTMATEAVSRQQVVDSLEIHVGLEADSMDDSSIAVDGGDADGAELGT